jgi:hypothetical protein
MELLYLNSFYRVLRSNGFAERSTHHSAFFWRRARFPGATATMRSTIFGFTEVLGEFCLGPGRANDEDFAGTGDGV